MEIAQRFIRQTGCYGDHNEKGTQSVKLDYETPGLKIGHGSVWWHGSDWEYMDCTLKSTEKAIKSTLK